MFTEDLFAMAKWLKDCGVKSVAMESTGVYWIPLFQILDDQGFDVTLVNPNYPKKPKKSDVEDCQWLQYLHAVGLLTPSFRPDKQVVAVRSIMRHRTSHVQESAAHIQRMQKILTEMNLLLHNVISDITGKTGLAIIDAILAGERDPHQLAKNRDPRIKASAEVIAKSLVGDFRDEHLFALRQSLEAYRFFHAQMDKCNAEIERMLAKIDGCIDIAEHPLPNIPRRSAKSHKNTIELPTGDLRSELYRILGVDLTLIPGIEVTTAHALFCEIGADLSKFPTVHHFVSWLGLCPNNRISGGKVLFNKTRRVKSRASLLLRIAAGTLKNCHYYLGQFYRRVRARVGPAAANVASAHKIARIIYHMITTKTPYDETVFENASERYQKKRLENLKKQAKQFGYTLAPA
jgi:transposase